MKFALVNNELANFKFDRLDVRVEVMPHHLVQTTNLAKPRDRDVRMKAPRLRLEPKRLEVNVQAFGDP